MTSKDLFFKLLWRDIKGRMWVTVVLLLIFMVRLPVQGLTAIEMNLLYLDEKIILKKQLMDEMIGWVSSSNGSLLILIILGAALCASTGFSYLHSFKKLDVYHSIPLKREKLLAIQYFSGLFLFLLPFLLCHLLYIMICLSKGIYTSAAAVQILGHIATGCCIFLLVYHVAIAAFMLTGRLLVGIAALAVILIYPYLLYEVIMGYALDFFSTYYVNFSDDRYGASILSRQYDTMSIGVIFIAAVLTAALIPWLYKHRPSEAAGNSIAFTSIKPIVKVLLIVPVAMGSGLFAHRMTSVNADIWLVTGVIFGLLIAQCMIEIVYSYDVKAVVSHRVSFGAACVITALLVIVFRFDLIGYDRYMPDKNNISAMGIYVEQLGMRDYYGDDFSPMNGLEDMHLEECAEAYQVVEMGIERQAILDRMSEEELAQEYGQLVYVRYKLKSGRIVMRQYLIPLEDICDELRVLYDESGFREGIFPILKDSVAETDEVILSDVISEKQLKLNGDNMTVLIEAYKTDVMALTFDEIINISSVGKLEFMQMEEWHSQSYPVYMSFKNTLTMLEGIGYTITTEIDPQKVTEIEFYDTEENYKGLDLDAENEEGLAVITDQADIERLIPLLVWEGSSGIATEDSMYAVVYIENGAVYGRYYSVRKDREIY